jgi:ribosomal protein S18 acetylase RimI-like enzyme
MAREARVVFGEGGRVLVINDRKGHLVAECEIIDEDQASIYIKSLTVHDRWLRMGYGTIMMNAVFGRFSDKEAVSLHVETINETAIAFYRSLGFFVAVATVHRGWDLSECRPHYLMTRQIKQIKPNT